MKMVDPCREDQRRTKGMAQWPFIKDPVLGNISVRSPCQEAASQKLSGHSLEPLPTHFSAVNKFSYSII